MRNDYFEGYYFKHQKDNNTIAFIPGSSNGASFIQVITNDNSYYFAFPGRMGEQFPKRRRRFVFGTTSSATEYKKGKVIKIGNNSFSKNGIKININDGGTVIKGHIRYTGLTPLKYDIMGFFKYFHMECRHAIISMSHRLDGRISINGQIIDLTGGIGYIERDSGISFPKSYIWLQCNDFKEQCSVVVSLANIPFMGFHFTGCICAIHYKNKEYRLATYLGVKIISYNREEIVLRQGKYTFLINVLPYAGQLLLAPQSGKMERMIHECISCRGRFRLYENGQLLFDLKSSGVSFECV